MNLSAKAGAEEQARTLEQRYRDMGYPDARAWAEQRPSAKFGDQVWGVRSNIGELMAGAAANDNRCGAPRRYAGT